MAVRLDSTVAGSSPAQARAKFEDENQQGKNDFFHGGQCLLHDVMR
jgi:hypothetical protein